MAEPTLRGRSVIVTGGAGFIGSHLVDRLIGEDPAKITVVDNLWLGKRANLADARRRSGVDLRVVDAASWTAMRKVLRRTQADVVFGLATIPLPASLARPRWATDRIVRMATVLAELVRLGEYGTLVYCSSSEAYGTAARVPMTEEHPYDVETPYAAAKAAGDLIVRSYWRTFGIDAVIVRPFNTYGPRQNDGDWAGIVPLTLRRLRDGVPPVIEGDGKQTRDLLYVSDTVEALVRAYRVTASRQRVVNVASGVEVSVLDIVRRLCRIAGYRGEIVHAPPRPADVRRHRGDATLARELLGFRPRVRLAEGLRRTVAWYLGAR